MGVVVFGSFVGGLPRLDLAAEVKGRKMTRKQYQELKKLHKLVIHNQQKIADDKEWYRLARLETRQVARGGFERFGGLCTACGF